MPCYELPARHWYCSWSKAWPEFAFGLSLFWPHEKRCVADLVVLFLVPPRGLLQPASIDFCLTRRRDDQAIAQRPSSERTAHGGLAK